MADDHKTSPADAIQDVIDKALDSKNYSSLIRDINDSIKSVFDELNINVNISDHIKKDTASPENKKPDQKEKIERPIAARTSRESLPATVLTALGATFTAIFALSEFVVVMLSSAIEKFARAGFITFIVLLPLLLISIFVLVKGTRMNSRIKRFKKYLRIIGSRKSVEVKELADGIGRSAKYTAQDLKNMIDRDFFTNAHLDTLGTRLMLDQDAYDEYLRSMQQYRQKAEKEYETEKIFSAEGTGNNQELASTLEEGGRYLKEIHNIGDSIANKEFSQKTKKLEELVAKIFVSVRRKPDQLYKLRRFMNYYMPTTVKLLKAYKELEGQETEGETIEKSRHEIEDAVDSIIYAYEKLLDSFFIDSAVDISSDITVLESMFAQEGLSRDPFEKDTPGSGRQEAGNK